MHLISDIALKWICRQFPWWHFYDDFSVVSSNFCCIVSCRKICSLFLLEFCCSVLLYFSCTALALDLMNLKTGIVLQWAVLVLVVKFQVHQASIYVAKLKITPPLRYKFPLEGGGGFFNSIHQPKVIVQGKLIAVAYTLLSYWNLGGICKQE